MKAIHPGEFLREEFLKPLGFWQLAAEKTEVTPELAKLLSEHFKTSPEFWLRLQAQYEAEK